MAFDKEVMTRCVTLSGDVFNPSGSLTGGELLLIEPYTMIILLFTGSRPKTQPILLAVVQLKQWQSQVEDHHHQLAVVEEELGAVNILATR